MIYTEEIESIKNQIVSKFSPIDIYLFGSYAKGLITKKSDIDLCVIIDTDNKRELVQKILFEVESNNDLDVIIYTRDEWENHKDNPSTFAHIIKKTGVSLVGRYN